MSRLPGKKIRNESFSVDGVHVSVELRLLDSGWFYCAPDDNQSFKAASLDELRDKVRPYLEQARRLHFEPFISVEFVDADENSRYDNVRGREHHEEVSLDFVAGWLSTETVESSRNGGRRWINAYVDEKTCEIKPLVQRDRETVYSDKSSRDLIPFTPDRWRRLLAIADALKSVRGKIAEVLTDATGAKLEAMTLPKMLEAAPAKKAKK